MLEFAFPPGGSAEWDITITGSLYSQNGLGALGPATIPMLGTGGNPVPLGVVIGAPSTNPFTLTITDIMAGQDFYFEPAFVAKGSVHAPSLTGDRSLYLLYHDTVAGGVPYSVVIYKVSAVEVPGIRTKLGSKKGYFLS